MERISLSGAEREECLGEFGERRAGVANWNERHKRDFGSRIRAPNKRISLQFWRPNAMDEEEAKLEKVLRREFIFLLSIKRGRKFGLICCVSFVGLLRATNRVEAKGLVGKLPGNPASCQEEPCNSDPQHVLYALKWMSLVFGLILLLPILMYYISKLFSKLHVMCCGGGKSELATKSKPNTEKQQRQKRRRRRRRETSSEEEEEEEEAAAEEPEEEPAQREDQEEALEEQEEGSKRRRKKKPSSARSLSSHSNATANEMEQANNLAQHKTNQTAADSQGRHPKQRQSIQNQLIGQQQQRPSLVVSKQQTSCAQLQSSSQLIQAALQKSPAQHPDTAARRSIGPQHVRPRIFSATKAPDSGSLEANQQPEVAPDDRCNAKESFPQHRPSIFSPERRRQRLRVREDDEHEEHDEEEEQQQQHEQLGAAANQVRQLEQLDANCSPLASSYIEQLSTQHHQDNGGTRRPSAEAAGVPVGRHRFKHQQHKVFPAPDQQAAQLSSAFSAPNAPGHTSRIPFVSSPPMDRWTADAPGQPDQLSANSLLSVPSLGPQHRHSIDGSILNNMLYLQQISAQAATTTQAGPKQGATSAAEQTLEQIHNNSNSSNNNNNNRPPKQSAGRRRRRQSNFYTTTSGHNGAADEFCSTISGHFDAAGQQLGNVSPLPQHTSRHTDDHFQLTSANRNDESWRQHFHAHQRQLADLQQLKRNSALSAAPNECNSGDSNGNCLAALSAYQQHRRPSMNAAAVMRHNATATTGARHS